MRWGTLLAGRLKRLEHYYRAEVPMVSSGAASGGLGLGKLQDLQEPLKNRDLSAREGGPPDLIEGQTHHVVEIVTDLE